MHPKLPVKQWISFEMAHSIESSSSRVADAVESLAVSRRKNLPDRLIVVPQNMQRARTDLPPNAAFSSVRAFGNRFATLRCMVPSTTFEISKNLNSGGRKP
jgi:hypothetical protein